MVHVPSLPQSQRLVLAVLSGTAARYGIGDRRDVPREVAVAAVHSVTTDPVLLGIQAGVALVDPHGINGQIVELLRAAGADMTVAQQHAVEVSERLGWTGIVGSSDGGVADDGHDQGGDGHQRGY
ncbi:hypothetical protein QTQ03_18210 [Micromonospora sp. WMMA1363]|uniref:hypothetical protein n=1 Tax=Micromonospora sp. WMMA1363 TaxID=3053985 RepID=UPI00259CD022|nr:hypothetical protein [Micromonospora sp. WMMA1363]MDM4721440.1 hypothetical protein [Micromonospora sp. WMMA1363]